MIGSIHLKWKWIVLLTLGCSVGSLRAQDIHFSQFQHAPLHLNPGLTGVFEGDQRLTGLYRNQWSSVPVPFLTFSFAYDQKFYHKALGKGYASGGLVFHYDRAGDANLSWAQLGLNLAYTRSLTREHFLTAGLQVMAGQRAFQGNELYFDQQFNGDIFDPNLPTGELFDRTSVGFTDLGAGFSWFYRDEHTRTRLRAGIAGLHLNGPRVGFFSGSPVNLPRLVRLHGSARVEVHPDIDLTGYLLLQWQDPYREVMTTVGGRYHLNQTPGEELSLELGMGHRFGDAFSLLLGAYYRDWFAGLSYDINVSDFQVATGNRGGPEIALRYIIKKVKPPETFKSCPIF